jgi:hypothetical protein
MEDFTPSTSINHKCESKHIPVTGNGYQQGFEMLRIPHYLDIRFTDGCKVVSLTRRLLLYSPETLFFSSRYLCLLEAE